MTAQVKGSAAALGWFSTAEDLLRQHTGLLNRLNVFPVADSDTGSNMTQALTACRVSVEKTESEDLGELLGAAGEAALQHAYGNSGTLTAVVISGISEPLRGQRRLTLPGLSAALQRASLRAWSALSDPVPGTMLSVLDAVRDEAMRAAAAADEPESRAALEAAVPALVAVADASVVGTRKQLAPLAEAKVIDAGGAGLALVIAALESTVLGAQPRVEALTCLSSVNYPDNGGDENRSTGMGPAGQEIMATVRMAPLQAAGLRHQLDAVASEVILTPIGQADPSTEQTMRWRIHAHAASPQAVLGVIEESGEVETTEVNALHSSHDDQR